VWGWGLLAYFVTVPPVQRLLIASLAALCLALVGAGVAIAGPAAPHGRLSPNEFRRIQANYAAIKKAYAGVQPDFSAARAACRILGASTALLRGEHRLCLDESTDLRAWLAVQATPKRCKGGGQTTSTASGTTTTDGPFAYELQQLLCQNSDYQALSREALRLQAADIALREIGIKRRLPGECLNTVVSTKQQLATEKQYVGRAWILATDLSLMIKVQNGQAGGNAMTASRLADDATALDDARDAWLGQAFAYPLSVCPH
jgi:hypothetical protein